jgi:hypothetical protein
MPTATVWATRVKTSIKTAPQTCVTTAQHLQIHGNAIAMATAKAMRATKAPEAAASCNQNPWREDPHAAGRWGYWL